MKRYSKYRNIKTTVNGITFDSRFESEYYVVLRNLERQGDIKNLRTQVPFVIFDSFKDGNGKWRAAIKYVADFVYETLDGETVVADTKSSATVTDIFRIKYKLFLYRYPKIRFEIVTKS